MITRWIAPTITALAVLALSACGTSHATLTESAPPAAPTAEQAFLGELTAYAPRFGADQPERTPGLIQLARNNCSFLTTSQGAHRIDVAIAISKDGYTLGEGLLFANEAVKYFCPTAPDQPGGGAPATTPSTPTTVTTVTVPERAEVATPLAEPTVINERQWSLIAKDPARHVGERVVVFGKVTQFDSATGTGAFRANVGAKRLPVTYGFVNYPTNTVLSGDEGGLANLVEGDIFRAEVTVTGPYSYDTQIGGSTTVPALTVTAYKVIGHV